MACFKQLGREVIYDAEHFFDGYAPRPGVRARDASWPPPRPAPTGSCCATPTAARCPRWWRAARRTSVRVTELATFPLGIHPHNDAGLAVANALAAVRAGCGQVQGTINGYGERCGNVDLVPLVATLQLKLGIPVLPPDALRRLTEVSHYVAAVANQHPDTHAPYVGRSAFAHKGGIHVAAIAKVAESYQHMWPRRTWGTIMRVVVSEVAGRRQCAASGARSWGWPSTGAETAVLQRIKELEHQGFQFEAAEGSFEMLLRRMAPDYRAPFVLRRLHRDRREARRGRDPGAGDRQAARGRRGHAHGRRGRRAGERARPGGAEGAAAALPRTRRGAPGGLQGAHRGRAPGHRRPARGSSSSRARGAERWSTVGCSENIIEASWLALCDALELALLRPPADD